MTTPLSPPPILDFFEFLELLICYFYCFKVCRIPWSTLKNCVDCLIHFDPCRKPFCSLPLVISTNYVTLNKSSPLLVSWSQDQRFSWSAVLSSFCSRQAILLFGSERPVFASGTLFPSTKQPYANCECSSSTISFTFCSSQCCRTNRNAKHLPAPPSFLVKKSPRAIVE